MKSSDNWQTPSWLLEYFKGYFDPCPTDPQKDGLVFDWDSPAYVNPPYSDPMPWIEKAIEQSRKGVKVVMLLRVDTSTKWYKLLIEEGAHIAYFNERLHFNDVKGSSNFSSMLVFLDPEVI